MCEELEKTALGMANARLGILQKYEGCRIRLCIEGECYSGVLEWVDIVSATAAIRDLADESLVIITVNPNSWELQLYGCHGTTTVPDGTEGVEDGTG